MGNFATNQIAPFYLGDLFQFSERSSSYSQYSLRDLVKNLIQIISKE